MKFGSVCSGIEAASVAWHPLGWQAAWLSEIEPFPSAVLKYHYANVPNLGDMTTLPSRILSGEVEAPDLFCGGTPCQAFSVAGLRKSLDDARGNLSLTFCEIANAIDTTRSVRGEPPCIVFWENVPGVLSTTDNAFGCFLAGLAGEDGAIEPPGGKWTNAGCVYGPQRAVAWRVLDAQYFGVAQRRRRVFVVASSREGFDPAKVLFEFDGMRRDTAPSREAGQATAPSTGAGAQAGGQSGLANDNISAARMVAFGEYVEDGTASAMKARDYKDATDLVAQAIPIHDQATRFNGGGDGRKQDGKGNGLGVGQPGDPAPTLTKGDKHAVAHAIASPVVIDRAAFNQGENAQYEPFIGATELMPSLVARGPHAVGQPIGFNARQDPVSSVERVGAIDTDGGTQAVAHPIPYDLHQVTAPVNRQNRKPGDPCHTLAKENAHNAGIVLPRAYSFDSLSSNSMQSGNPISGCRETELSKTLDTTVPTPIKNQGGIAVVQPTFFENSRRDGVRLYDDVSNTLQAFAGTGGRNGPMVSTTMAVRRLTPVECERLQGFPDNYTDIPWRTYQESQRKGVSFESLLAERGMTLRGPNLEACPDGPRYKALGNSWAVPVVRWIGRRIDAQIRGGTLQ